MLLTYYSAHSMTTQRHHHHHHHHAPRDAVVGPRIAGGQGQGPLTQNNAQHHHHHFHHVRTHATPLGTLHPPHTNVAGVLRLGTHRVVRPVVQGGALVAPVAANPPRQRITQHATTPAELDQNQPNLHPTVLNTLNGRQVPPIATGAPFSHFYPEVGERQRRRAGTMPAASASPPTTDLAPPAPRGYFFDSSGNGQPLPGPSNTNSRPNRSPTARPPLVTLSSADETVARRRPSNSTLSNSGGPGPGQDDDIIMG
jgi:hypothetical protein